MKITVDKPHTWAQPSSQFFSFLHFKYEWPTKDYQASEGSLKMKDKTERNRKQLEENTMHRQENITNTLREVEKLLQPRNKRILYSRSPKASADAKEVHGINTIKNPCTRRTSGVSSYSLE